MKKILNGEFLGKFIMSAFLIFSTISIINHGTYGGFIGLALIYWLYYKYKRITKFRKISKAVIKDFLKDMLLNVFCTFLMFNLNVREKGFIDVLIDMFVLGGMALGTLRILIKDIPAIIGELVAIKKMNKIQYTVSDMDGAEDYFRDILKIASPLIIGYTDNLKLDKNTILSELLYLKDKGIIKIENGRIIEVPKEIPQALLPCEQFLLKMISDGKIHLKENNLEKVRARVEEDATSVFSLIKTGDNREVENRKRIILESLSKWMLIISIILICFAIPTADEVMLVMFGIIAFIIFMIEIVKDKPEPNFELMKNVVLALVGLILIDEPEPIVKFGFWIAFGARIIFSYLTKRYDSGTLQIRTEKGEELNEKIEGLKIFLRDYSLLNEKKSEHIALWQEYLIYSVIAGQNMNIADEFKDCIEF